MAKQPRFDSTAYKEGLRAQIDRSSLTYSDWAIRNFRHPKNGNIPWSFQDHEFQIEIINCGDSVPVVWVTKCAQVGLSTLQIVSALTFCAVHDYLKSAYVLPTAKFATEFSAMRIDPMIASSPTVSSLMSPDTDNTGMKKIGTCFLVMRGTSGESQAISVDLDCLLIDEFNFCVQKTLSSFSSRLQHSLLKLRRNFSTPTLPDFGVSAGFLGSSQGFRAVHCNHCSTWVIPDFFNDVVIPGFDKPLSLFRASDYSHPGVAESYLSCPSCHRELTTDLLNDPQHREWVHKFPNRDERGYQVMPWDVPKYNPIPEILLDIKNYTYQDWCNFRLGLPHESEENSINLETVKRNCVLRPILLDELLRGSVLGVFIGSDLGKTNHYMVGVHNPVTGTLDVVHVNTMTVSELLETRGDPAYGPFLKDLHTTCWSYRTVLDHAPSWEPALYLHQQLPEGKSYGAYYVKSDRKSGSLDIYNFNNTKGSVNIDRNNHFDDVVNAVNTGKIRFPFLDAPHIETMLSHFKVLKKVKETNSKGQMEETWTSTSTEDHFAHALGYLWCAYSSVEARFNLNPVRLLPTPGKVKLKS